MALLLIAFSVAACPVMAAPDVAILAVRAEDAGNSIVELRLMNGEADALSFPLPDKVEAQLSTEGQRQTVWLQRSPDTPPSVAIAAGGFQSARYMFSMPPGLLGRPEITLSAPALAKTRIVFSPPSSQLAAERDAEPLMQSVAVPPSDSSAGNAFLSNLYAYEPIYAVYGPGTESSARLQLSLKYQLFGSRRRGGEDPTFAEGLFAGYTQRMFWDLEARSSPFRNIDYQAEFFWIAPSRQLRNGTALTWQAGVRHESNGRDGEESRSVNSVYVAPMAAFPVGNGYTFSVVPRLSLWMGKRINNQDIRRYRGNLSLGLEIGEDDGIRLSTHSRFDFGSGMGSFAADLSYPLRQFWRGSPDFYLYGQSFLGYGENLLDYNKKDTRFRVGLAIVR